MSVNNSIHPLHPFGTIIDTFLLSLCEIHIHGLARAGHLLHVPVVGVLFSGFDRAHIPTFGRHVTHKLLLEDVPFCDEIV